MARKGKRKKQNRDNKASIRRKINSVVVSEFGGCIAEFSGGVGQSRMATRGPTFGFRVKNVQTGKYRSNVIWLNPHYSGDFSTDWIRNAIKESNS